MKPFNLEEAKQGKPVCTREGDPVRLLCFDYKDENYSIIGLISYGEYESIATFTEEGKCSSNGSYTNNDLFMASVKHEGWINIYPDNDCSGRFYLTEEQAKSVATIDVITTVKIEWEE